MMNERGTQALKRVHMGATQRDVLAMRIAPCFISNVNANDAVMDSTAEKIFRWVDKIMEKSYSTP